MEIVGREDLRKQTPQSRWIRLKHVIVAIQAMKLLSLARKSRTFKDLELKSIIDESSSDKVYKVVDRLSGETYALKEFNGISYSEEINNDIEILKKLNNPNLVKCYQIFHVDHKIFLLLEPLDRGSLAGIKVGSEFDLARYVHQVLLGLRYLHQNHFWHGDIKPSNIFVNHFEQVKVLFPGRILSTIKAKATAMVDIHDRFSWDIWNVGLCTLKLSKGLNWSSKIDKVIRPKHVPTSSQHKEAVVKPSIEFWGFLSSCMKTESDVAKRSTADELIGHPFFELLSLKGKGEVPRGEGEEQHSPRKKKPRTYVEDEDSLHERALQAQFLPSTLQIVNIGTLEDDFSFDNPFESFLAHPVAASDKEDFPFDDSSLYFPAADLSAFSSKSVISSVSGDASSEVTTCEGEKQISPRKKKPQTSVKDEDSEYDERAKDRRHHTHFQRCIEHCSLFLPGCEFEKDKLVQMWIAEECIELDVTKRMEDIANSYFDALVDEEVVVPSKFDNLYRTMKYKVNTARVHTWRFKEGIYVSIDAGNSDKICEEALHFTWQCKTLDRALSDALKNLKQLRTLVLIEDCSGLIKQLPSDIFLGLKLLRTLDLSLTHISELPGSIGSLKSLRFLDISETPIKRLPESMDRLYLLQTLKLKACFGLSALPRGFGSLINLRHLDLDIVSQLKCMPRGMGNLIQLQTLQAFLVGQNNGCDIGELKNMNEITGSFCISMLENVSNAEEAKGAALGDKKHIEKLELRWHDHVTADSQDTAEILEYLQPHFQLKELQITFYRGSKLPSWISNPLFTDLASITLYKCINCDILPSIGLLPSLKILHIVNMNNVKNIDALFCRIHGSRGFSAFPKLENLTIDNMLNLEEWSGIEDGDFPCLRHVAIRYCPKLYGLPSLSHLSSLQHLEICHCSQLMALPEGILPGMLGSLIIRGCPKINDRCVKDGGVDWFKISSVKNIWIDLEKISLD